MTAWEQAKRMYEKKGWDMDDDLATYCRYHYVHITPDSLILARLHTDHWYVHAAVGAGSLRLWMSIMPVYRPYVAWARGLRDGQLKYYQTERLKRLLL
jgi:hypothetical protein